MKIAYFDCFAGAAGDMILGALLDAGVSLESIRAELSRLPVDGYELTVERTMRRGIAATRACVQVGGSPADAEFVEVVREAAGAGQHSHHHHHHQGHRHVHGRPLKAILGLLEESGLSGPVKRLAERIFLRLGAAESRVHGVPLAEVHFHEVGGTDAIVDIVSAAAGLHLLGVDRVMVSPVHIGGGFVRTAHGLYPVPAPATAYLLEGVPIYSTQVQGELITPTGAAILAEVAAEYGPLPPLTVERIGYGAGSRDREIPNVLRLVLGEAVETLPAREPVVELAANIDDMNPQFCPHLVERLLSAGALDAWFTPVHMKKGRPGVVVHALASPSDAEKLTAVLTSESTTLGVRRQTLERAILDRELVPVDTPWGTVRVKLGRHGERVCNAAPEYEDCRRLALEAGVPLKAVYQSALTAALAAI